MTREEVLTLLPEIKLIHSTDLQEKSITCWQQVLELGGWDKKGVDKAPLAAGIVADNCPETGIDSSARDLASASLPSVKSSAALPAQASAKTAASAGFFIFLSRSVEARTRSIRV